MAKINTYSEGFGKKFKTAVSNASTKAKEYGKKVKDKAKEYGGKVNTAYNVGYYSGVNDYPKLPNNTFGAQTSATYGYSKGLKDSSKNQRYQNKIKNQKGR